jgi:hypothetical protein
MMKKAWVCVGLCFVPFLPLFSQQHINANIASWEAKFEFDRELYPSYILTVSGPHENAEIPKDYIGDPGGIAEVWIVSSVPNAKVHVDISIDGWASPSELDATLAKAGTRYRLAPYIRYDFVQLARTNQSYPAMIRYAVSVNGVDLGWDQFQLRVRSVNDVPFYVESDLIGESQDLSYLFAGFVNESHPVVQQILQEALDSKAVRGFVGYTGNPADVGLQVIAIWYALQRRGVRYSNATTPSAASLSGRVYSQAVRFIDESIDSQQANCVDGSVLFASVLYKIGIHPILVRTPEHMFVGYWLDEEHSAYEFLETTLLGEGRRPGSLKESANRILRAVEFANKVFNENVQPAVEKDEPGYFIIDIAEIRKLGINAIPRPGR